MNDSVTPKATERFITRLTAGQYRELENRVGQPDPRVIDPVQAGFQLGVQHVLKKVRDGFTAG